MHRVVRLWRGFMHRLAVAARAHSTQVLDLSLELVDYQTIV